MALSDSDIARIRELANMEVRAYFDYYLNNVLPNQLAQHAAGCVHGKKFSRFVWFLAGVCFASGGGAGVMVAKLFGS